MLMRVLLAFMFLFITPLAYSESDPEKKSDTHVFFELRKGGKGIVALPDFVNKDSDAETLALSNEIRDTAKEDLLFTRYFNLIEDGPTIREGKIDFDGWSKAGAELLIKGNVRRTGKKVSFIASVFEVKDGNPIFQKRYLTPARNVRQIGHKFIADFIYRFLGNRGISSSRISFANDVTGNKEIYVIDYDGKNLTRMTKDKSVSILPRWSPDGKEVLYTTWRYGNPDLSLYSFKTKKSKIFSRRKGLNTSASFSPDGKTIVATLSFQNQTNLYLLDRKGKILRRLTDNKTSDTSASFSADGEKIIFISDRPGFPQVYMMNSDGTSPERLSSGGWCDAPVWSPLGDKIAYSKGNGKGQHDIIVQDIESRKKIKVTSDSGVNENPSFSPDGRFVVFSSNRKGKRELYIASLDGIVQRKLLDIPGSSYTPAWGP